QRVPDLAEGLKKKIEQAHKSNKNFQKAFGDFFELCRTSLNPNLSQAAVDEMLIQHILTERLIREIFDNPEFVRRNVIAAEVEKVMQAMTSQSFDRNTYLRELDRFYVAIEHAARTMTDFADKQHFLNTVYERFFQGYSVKLADTMGIVYTPQEIVDFMCASVAEVLEKEFGKHLWSDDVYIIDPCTGTGNFIVNLIRRIPKKHLEDVYKHRLFANEIMLLPYYIAALNIEHAYFEQAGTYEAFEGLCFVDTLDLAEHAQKQLGFMTAANTKRVERQRKSPITVVIGNPPYNTGQKSENEDNKNRRYPFIESRVRVTYARDSGATNKNALSDAYVKFFRWAADRLQSRPGIVCFVSNNSFVEQLAFDGFRRHLLQDFPLVYHMHLEGNVRQDFKLAGSIYNVFGIQVGVGVTVAIRCPQSQKRGLWFARVDKYLRREAKLEWLAKRPTLSHINWARLEPSRDYTWIRPQNESAFQDMLPLATKEAKLGARASAEALFRSYSGGVKTNRDEILYDYSRDVLAARVRLEISAFNAEVDRYRREGNDVPIDRFVNYEKVKWSETLKAKLARLESTRFDEGLIRPCEYRPFTTKWLYYDDFLVERRYLTHLYFPTADAANTLIWIKVGAVWPMFALVSQKVVDLLPVSGSQVFPFYVYNEDGSNRRENITDWALKHFREHYKDKKIDKWAIFHYVYGILHHPGYREKFADNLKRELPRIPLAPPLRSPYPALPRGEGRGEGASSPEGTPECGHGREPVELDREGIAALEGRRKSGAARSRRISAAPPGRSARDDERTPGSRPGLQSIPPLGQSSNQPQGQSSDRLREASALPDGRGSDQPSQSSDLSSGFWAFSEAGKQLATLHLDYEKLKPHPLKFRETPGEPLSYRVDDKMRLSKDKTALRINESLTLEGIPAAAFNYRLGNRSALEWVIDQYQVYTDPRSQITSDPNRDDDPQYIVRLVGQVIRVSIATTEIVNALPEEFAPKAKESE
ncbi:MAG: N-6 DNA methylase, partial [Phycisphaerales bacterium]|nr:N-6 DNA methylase [Phycisphaerales bacterium]